MRFLKGNISDRIQLRPSWHNDERASVLLERIREEKARMAAKQQINLKQRGMKKMGRKRRLGGSPGQFMLIVEDLGKRKKPATSSRK